MAMSWIYRLCAS